MPRTSALATRKARGKATSATPPSSAESQLGVTMKSMPKKGRLGLSKKAKEKVEQEQEVVTVSQKRRKKNGQAAMQEIRKLQKTQNNLINKTAIRTAMREALLKYGPAYNLSPVTLQMMQDATESYMVQYFEDAQRVAIHSGRVTVMSRDLHLVSSLRHSDSILK